MLKTLRSHARVMVLVAATTFLAPPQRAFASPDDPGCGASGVECSSTDTCLGWVGGECIYWAHFSTSWYAQQ